MNMDVVKPGDKLSNILGINDLIAAPLLLLFYPMMDEEILEIIQQKDRIGSAHIAFISKEKLELLGSDNIWFIKDDDEETLFKAFGVSGNNFKAAFWIEEDGAIMTKIQQLTKMRFLFENIIPDSVAFTDKKPEMEDEIMNEDYERKEGFSWKSKPIRVGATLFCLIILLAVSLGFGYEFGMYIHI